MEIATKVNGRAIKCMEKESIISLMAEYMKVIIRMAKDVAMEYLSSQKVIAMTVNGRMTQCMEKESKNSLMAEYMKVNFS